MGEKREKKNTPPTETLSMDLFTYKCAYDGSDTLSICEGWELELGCFGPISSNAALCCWNQRDTENKRAISHVTIVQVWACEMKHKSFSHHEYTGDDEDWTV